MRVADSMARQFEASFSNWTELGMVDFRKLVESEMVFDSILVNLYVNILLFTTYVMSL